jgi:hypothetical protein
MDLFPQRIERIQHVVDRKAVRVRNACDAIYAIDNTARVWVKKVTMGANELLAEAVGWLLSKRIGVPIAEAAVHAPSATEAYWLSGLISPAKHWQPSMSGFLANPSEFGAMFALDAIIGNWDRHAGNILAAPIGASRRVRVVSIDVAGAWVGTSSDLLAHAGETPAVDGVAPGIPVDLIRDGAAAAAAVAEKLEPDIICDYVREACQLAGSSEEKVISAAVIERCCEATRLVDAYLKKLEARP